MSLSITQNDLLNKLVSFNPFVVGLLVWFTGWGSLFLIGWGTNNLDTLLSLKFMIGDFIMLPLAGGLITYFYQSVKKPSSLATSKNITYFASVFATSITVISTLYSLFISHHYQGVWSIPHTVFIWLMSYILVSFISRGFIQILHSERRKFFLGLYSVVLLAISIYLITLGFKYFPA